MFYGKSEITCRRKILQILPKHFVNALLLKCSYKHKQIIKTLQIKNPILIETVSSLKYSQFVATCALAKNIGTLLNLFLGDSNRIYPKINGSQLQSGNAI